MLKEIVVLALKILKKKLVQLIIYLYFQKGHYYINQHMNHV
jgi:hypothetical protein